MTAAQLTIAPRDLGFESEVIAAEAGDVERRGDVVLFWGGWPSQWHPSPFRLDGVVYTCTEQYMMAEKARLFGDGAALTAILGTAYPKAMKEAGRAVTPFDPERWDAVSRDVVFRANLAKFTQSPDLAALLAATGDAVIGEASPYDDLWGIGFDAADPRAADPAQWVGSNWLGVALMRVRRCLLDACNT